jgi:SRSO17 transposase
MISRAGVRWQIEEDNREAKQLVGLGGYQVRTWTARHRHVTCAMLALAFPVVQRAHHPDPEPPAEGPGDLPSQVTCVPQLSWLRGGAAGYRCRSGSCS